MGDAQADKGFQKLDAGGAGLDHGGAENFLYHGSHIDHAGAAQHQKFRSLLFLFLQKGLGNVPCGLLGVVVQGQYALLDPGGGNKAAAAHLLEAVAVFVPGIGADGDDGEGDAHRPCHEVGRFTGAHDGLIGDLPQGVAVAKGVSITPYTCVDKWGNKCIVESTINMDMAERVGKMISDASYGSTGICGMMIPVEELDGKYVPNTMDEALACGRIIREEQAAGRCIADAICEKLGAVKLFAGKVVEKPWEDRDGYYWGSHIMEGTGEFAGHRAEVVFKNENQLFYLDGELVVSSPDLIMNVDVKTNAGRRNEDIYVGDDLVILGRACKKELREEAMLKTLEPRHFGVDKDYVPIEEYVK